MTAMFLCYCCILRSLVTLNHRYICSQQTKESSAHVIGIATTYQSHIKIIPNIFPAHGLSGCDAVCSYFGIGKKTVINVLNKKNIDLSSIGFLHEPLENYLKQGIHFLLCCYGQSKVETLNGARIEMIHLFNVEV